MIFKYRIDILDYYGKVREVISDFQTLQIIEIANAPGSWKVTSTTKEKCPFQPGDFIRVYRDNLNIYNGILTRYEEEYVVKYGAWKWSASGANFLEILNCKIVSPNVSGGLLTERNYEEGTANSVYTYNIIKHLIEKCAKWNTQTSIDDGFMGVKGCYRISPNNPVYGSVVSRFENLLETVIKLANDADTYIIPSFDDETEEIIFIETSGTDLSGSIIFNDHDGHILRFNHVVEWPEATDVVMSFNSDELASGNYAGHNMWEFFSKKSVPNANTWRRVGHNTTIFVAPNQEDFQVNGTPVFSKENLDALCEKNANSRRFNVDCYEIEIDPTVSPFTYGNAVVKTQYGDYAWETDYRIGNKIGIRIQGESYTGIVTKMQYDVQYGVESIRPSIGDMSKGVFNSLQRNIRNLKNGMGKINNTEVR